MTKRPPSEKPQRLANRCMRSAISGLSSGVNLLNSGAMTVGNSQRIRKLNSTQVPQAHQTQLGPVFPMIHKTLAARGMRSEEHTSELQSLMRTSYAVFCLKKKNTTNITRKTSTTTQ